MVTELYALFCRHSLSGRYRKAVEARFLKALARLVGFGLAAEGAGAEPRERAHGDIGGVFSLRGSGFGNVIPDLLCSGLGSIGANLNEPVLASGGRRSDFGLWYWDS